MKRILLSLSFIICHFSFSAAQTTFSVMTLNVDGLPGKFLFFDINPDGPLSAGSERISQYIAAKDCDIVSMQECFNYRWEIWSRLFAGYEHDEWTGGIDSETHQLDYFHLQNERFPCDGLNSAWKKDVTSTAYERVAHEQNFGKFSHEFDDIITKGFRRHEFTLADGTQIVVYNTHFDASSERDELLGNDVKDREARLAQWQQLREHVMAHLNSRPVILTGDFNSYYNRDDIVAAFLQPIEATGRATVGDVWIEKCRGGVYPQLGDERDADEVLDKILYVNPVGGMAVNPVSVTLDVAGYQYDNQPMGDHYPLIATFTVDKDKTTGIVETVNGKSSNSKSSNSKWFDLQGRHITPLTPDLSPLKKGLYIQNGHKYIAK